MKPSKSNLRNETTHDLHECELASVTGGGFVDLGEGGAGTIKKIGPTPQPAVNNPRPIDDNIGMPQF